MRPLRWSLPRSPPNHCNSEPVFWGGCLTSREDWPYVATRAEMCCAQASEAGARVRRQIPSPQGRERPSPGGGGRSQTVADRSRRPGRGVSGRRWCGCCPWATAWQCMWECRRGWNPLVMAHLRGGPRMAGCAFRHLWVSTGSEEGQHHRRVIMGLTRGCLEAVRALRILPDQRAAGGRSADCR